MSLISIIYSSCGRNYELDTAFHRPCQLHGVQKGRLNWADNRDGAERVPLLQGGIIALWVSKWGELHLPH